jgi:hypothetical protein
MLYIGNFMKTKCTVEFESDYHYESSTSKPSPNRDPDGWDSDRVDITTETHMGKYYLNMKHYDKLTKRGFERMRDLDESLLWDYQNGYEVNAIGFIVVPDVADSLEQNRNCYDRGNRERTRIHNTRKDEMEQLLEVLKTLDSLKRNVISRYDYDDRFMDYVIYFHMPGSAVIELKLTAEIENERYISYYE